jgi:hypothetical protein
MNPGKIFPEELPRLEVERPIVAPVGQPPHALLDPG